MNTVTIGSRKVGGENSVFIIAEAGVNHNGDFARAMELIDIASNAKADAVKFQSFDTEELILDSVEKAEYQVENTGTAGSQYEMLKSLEMGPEKMNELKEYAEEKGLVFLTTPFDPKSLDALDTLDLQAIKVASTDTTNIPFLRAIARKGKPMILSTGMCKASEVRQAVETIVEINQQLILLQCTSNYPMDIAEANLRVIRNYEESFPIVPGYSDHSPGIGVSPYAVAVGAKVIEKHFTTDKALPGPDHRASLDPEELKQFVSQIRDVEIMLGSDEKQLSNSEHSTRKSLQKSLVARKAIEPGELFSEENLVAKRTGGEGVSPLMFDKFVGKKCSRSYAKDELIESNEC